VEGGCAPAAKTGSVTLGRDACHRVLVMGEIPTEKAGLRDLARIQGEMTGPQNSATHLLSMA
jgi:hypothetical protein